MEIRLKGKIEVGDECRVEEEATWGAIRIGGVDLVEKAEETFKAGVKLTVGIKDERFEGPLSVELGWGYSEYTPMDSDKLKVGDRDLLEELAKREGEEIELILSDGPINILGPDEGAAT